MVDWQSESDLDSIRNSCDVSNPRMLFFTEPPPEKMSMAYSPTSHYRNRNRILTFRVLELESDFWKLSNNLSGQNLLSAQDFKNDVPTYMEFNQFWATHQEYQS